MLALTLAIRGICSDDKKKSRDIKGALPTPLVEIVKARKVL